MESSQAKTSLYCQSCGWRLHWQGEMEPKLEADGTLRGFTLRAVCIQCGSQYKGWLYVGLAPEWWEETRADSSRSTHKHDSLKNYQRATSKRATQMKTEVNDEPESFYIDTFVNGQQLEITHVLRAIGGNVVYDRDARHLGEPRARYCVTLPAGCKQTGLEGHLAPQTITLPGGRSLCVYPGDESVTLGWLPGDSRESALWDGATRRNDA